MSESRNYIAFRFVIVPIEGHLFTEPVPDDQKLEWFRQAFLRNHEYEGPFGTQYAIRVLESSQYVSGGKFSRRRITELHEKATDDIRDRAVEDWPYLEFLCDTTRGVQLIVFEFLTQVVQKPGMISTVLMDLVREPMWQHGYAVYFHPIVEEHSFWKVVDNAKGIFRLRLTLSSPNLFGAQEAARGALKEIQEIFNNSTASFTLENEKGELRIPRDRIDNLRQYADEGCGTWELAVKRGKRKRIVKSSERTAKITVEVEDSEEGRAALGRAIDRFRDLI